MKIGFCNGCIAERQGVGKLRRDGKYHYLCTICGCLLSDIRSVGSDYLWMSE